MHAPASTPASANSAPAARHLEVGQGQLLIPNAPPLAPLQLQAAQLLAAGHHLSDIARSLSVSRATLYRWQQAPDFAAYFNQLVRQRSDEALAASSCLMVDSLDLVRDTLADPKTPIDRRLQIAFRMMSLYARPSFLKHLNSLSDDPRVIAEAQCRQSFVAAGQPIPPEGFADDEIALFSCMQDSRLEQTEALDAKLPNQEPLPRDKMRQNETLRQRPTDPAPAPTAPPAPRPAAPSAISNLKSPIPIISVPAAIPADAPVSKLKATIPFDAPFQPVPASPSQGAMRQNEAPSACTSAIDTALAGLRHDIALATTGVGPGN